MREIPTNRCLATSVSYWNADLNRVRSEASFCFSGLPARRALISLGLPGLSRQVSIFALGYVFIRLGASTTFRLRDSGWNDFLGDPKVSGSPGVTRFEAFPAVYRAPSLFWHRSVMNSRSFSDSPGPRGPTNSHSRSSVSPARGNRPTLVEGVVTVSGWIGDWPSCPAERSFASLLRPPRLGRGCFSQLVGSLQHPDCFFVGSTNGWLGFHPAHRITPQHVDQEA